MLNKIIIAGGRTFNDYHLLKSKLDIILSNLTDIEIVSGACRGADILGERYAKEHNHGIKYFPADWTKGKGAGFTRNNQMARYATHLVAFWDGSSKGTAHMIDTAKQYNLHVRVVRY